MAPGDSSDDIIARARGRWTESSIVYTRRNRKKAEANSITGDGGTIAENPTSVVTTVVAAAEEADNGCPAMRDFLEASVTKDKDDDGSVQEPEDGNNLNPVPEASGSLTTELRNPEDDFPSPNIINEGPNSNDALDSGDLSPFSGGKGLQNSGEVDGALTLVGNESEKDGESASAQGNANGVVEPLVISSFGDRIRFNLSKATQKSDIIELKRALLSKLDQVTRLVKQLEAKEIQIIPFDNTQIINSNLSDGSNYRANGDNISEYSHTQHTRSEVIDRRLSVRVNSEVGPQESRPVAMGLSRVNSDIGAMRNMEPNPYSRQLSLSVMENNNRGGEFVEKEKRTPKANQFYRNSEFLLGKDRLPSESNKRPKTNNGRRRSGELNNPFGSGAGFEKNRNHIFKNCSSLLQRLMKHKHGWVFNEPVNANSMGLVDYHDIIKHPMDLGTIKTQLSQNWYKSPMDFAEDVRLVFFNAMTYNPKGQDVHVMAKQLLDIFEERWAIIESQYNNFIWKHQTYPDGSLPTPTSRRPPPLSHFEPSSAVSAPISLYTPPAAQQMRAFERPEPIITSMAVDPKIQRPHAGRTPVPRKPKAKDPDKRDMTYDEKQKLSTNLQGLPSEKLDAIVQIIKRGNTALSQHDDEIEVDIDSVNAETLWELDRFVTNYKKSLSKNKRKAELALQARTAANQNVALTSSVPSVANQIGSGTAYGKSTDPRAEGEKRMHNGSRSSSSSSSSSDSGSSSSDSDSDSSSGDGSDAGHSPRS